MAIPAADTVFIGIILPANASQKRSQFINDLSRGYTAAEIAAAAGITSTKDYWFLSSSTSAQHDDFIGKSFYNFKVFSAGTDMVTGGVITESDFNSTTGTITYGGADLSGQEVCVSYTENFEVIA